MKKLMVLMAILVMAHTAGAQLLNPVKWSYAAKLTGRNEAVLLFKATIDDGWHIYSVHQAPGGPVKTAFKFIPGTDYTLAGKISEPVPAAKFEDAFGIDVKYFEKEVIFRQKIRLKSVPAVIRGKLTYMVCNDRQCLPPSDIAFRIPVK